LKKLFAGINSVDFKKDNTLIVAMKSSSNELVNFLEPISVENEVEEWMMTLSLGM
jgi:dynein heavy chain 2